MTTPLPPDFEDRHRLALTLCQHLDINPEHVLLGTMQIELGPDHKHQVTWTGHAHLNLDDLTELLLRARHHIPDRPCVNAPQCTREAGHRGQCTRDT